MASHLPETLREKLECMAADSGDQSALALAILILESRLTSKLFAQGLEALRERTQSPSPADRSDDIPF